MITFIRTLILISACLRLGQCEEAETSQDFNSTDPEGRRKYLTAFASGTGGSDSSDPYGQGSSDQSGAKAFLNVLEDDEEDSRYARPNPYGSPDGGYGQSGQYGSNYGNKQESKLQNSVNIALNADRQQSDGFAPSSSGNRRGEKCRYWCRNDDNENYCCETIDQKPSYSVYTKRGFCPAVRQSCPTARLSGAGRRQEATPCAHDQACYGSDKCCYDRCRERHVCKPAISPYGPWRPYEQTKSRQNTDDEE